MRSCRVSLFALLVATAWVAHVEAAACAEICYTTDLTGFAPGGTPGCTCSGSTVGERTGAGGCNCGQCYEKTQGVIIGFAINNDGTCTYGTDCGNCELESRLPTNSSTNSPTSTTSTPSPVPATSAPIVASSSSAPNDTSSGASASAGSATNLSSSVSDSSSASVSSNSNSKDKAGNNASSEPGSNTKDQGLSLWQIVLAISCTVLIFMVAVVSVFACYCKARSRLYEHEEDQDNYYNQRTPEASYQPWVPGRAAQPVDSKSNIV